MSRDQAVNVPITESERLRRKRCLVFTSTLEILSTLFLWSRVVQRDYSLLLIFFEMEIEYIVADILVNLKLSS